MGVTDRVNTKLWSIFGSRGRCPSTIPTPGMPFTASMPISSCSPSRLTRPTERAPSSWSPPWALIPALWQAHFTILRELVTFEKQDKCVICGQLGHVAADCKGKAKVKEGEFDEKSAPQDPRKPFQFLHISILREYLDREFQHGDYSTIPGGYNLEAVIDDFVFLCFFIAFSSDMAAFRLSIALNTPK